MKFSWHGHAVVQIQTHDKRIIIDPFIEGNKDCDLSVDEIKVDYILLTHAHNDHVGDTVQIAKNNDATVIAMVELADYLGSFDIKTHGMNIGGAYQFPFGKLKCTQAIHSSSYNDGEKNIPLGLANGFLLDDGFHTLYHAGDTALFSDMALLGPVDVAFLPIGDNFTMGIDDAIKASALIKPKLSIPIHYNTFPIITQDPNAFTSNVSNGRLPAIGEVIELKGEKI